MVDPVAGALYRAATGLLESIAPALLASRARHRQGGPGPVAERLARAETARPEGPLVWLHGSQLSARACRSCRWIERLRAERPGGRGRMVTFRHQRRRTP
ncbi:hypothetical protein ACRAWD_04175 [Caulobacter segnis]